jgi:hypothetical protein
MKRTREKNRVLSSPYQMPSSRQCWVCCACIARRSPRLDFQIGQSVCQKQQSDFVAPRRSATIPQQEERSPAPLQPPPSSQRQSPSRTLLRRHVLKFQNTGRQHVSTQSFRASVETFGRGKRAKFHKHLVEIGRVGKGRKDGTRVLRQRRKIPLASKTVGELELQSIRSDFLKSPDLNNLSHSSSPKPGMRPRPSVPPC